MSRGRKPNIKGIVIDWNFIFKKNIGTYFKIILSHLGDFKNIGVGHGIEVLNEIKKEKEKRNLKDKPFPKIRIDEIPYKIPDNWIWCRLGEMSINRDGERNPIAMSDRNNREKIYDYYGASGVIDKIDGYTHEGELLLVGEDGANLISRSTPIAFIAEGKYWVNNHAHVIETVQRITLDYLKCYINSINLKPFITGGFQPKLSQGNLNIIPVPLPPLSFQEKILEFFLDFENNNIKPSGFYFNSQIERKILELHKSQLSASTIIIENNFQLTQLENLNQAILQEAVQGKLVAQNLKDEPSNELLKRIKAEKANSGKKEKPLPPIKPEEIPFDIPENWVWCRLGEIIEFNYGKGLTKEQCIPNGRYPVFGSNGIVGHYNKYLTDKRTIIAGRKGSAGALNICEVPSWTTDVAYYVEEMKDMIFDFQYYLLKSLQLDKLGKGIKPGLNRNEAYLLPIPLPPLSEQKRIVAEIERQLAKTKQLKEHIIANQKATEQLLKALLHQAFQPTETAVQVGEVKDIEEI